MIHDGTCNTGQVLAVETRVSPHEKLSKQPSEADIGRFCKASPIFGNFVPPLQFLLEKAGGLLGVNGGSSSTGAPTVILRRFSKNSKELESALVIATRSRGSSGIWFHDLPPRRQVNSCQLSGSARSIFLVASGPLCWQSIESRVHASHAVLQGHQTVGMRNKASYRYSSGVCDPVQWSTFA